MKKNKPNKEHILKLIDFMYCEMCSSGDDGDGIWYTRYYCLEDIFEIVKEYNTNLKFPMEVNFENNMIHFGQGEEWIIITNDENVYNESPEWIQIKIKY